jgi:uncharacterized protein YecT (DUF1311 family)
MTARPSCRRIPAWLSISLALAAMPSMAQTSAEIEARHTPAYARCMDNSGGVTIAMRDCAAAEIDIQDARLNATYRSVMRRLTAVQRDRLRRLERQWIVSREADCREAANFDGGGTLALIVGDGCWLSSTIGRTIWLERYRP